MMWRKQITLFALGLAILGSGCAVQPRAINHSKVPAVVHDARVPKVDQAALTAVAEPKKIDEKSAPAGLSPVGMAAVDNAAEAQTAPLLEEPRRPSKARTSKRQPSYYWQPDKAPSGPVKIVVSLADQQAYVYRNGVLIGKSRVSTGRKGFETPTGTFNILQKEKEHTSNLYENGNMPYMQRLTWDGLALHGGRVPGYRASHGCVRLPHSFSKLVYGITSHGAKVVITGDHEGVVTAN